MKKYLKYSFIFILVCVIVFCVTYFISALCGDEVWNYGFAYNISTGLVPYRDFNMIVTPLYHFIVGFFIIIFGNHIWSMYIFNSIMITFMLFIMYKKIGKSVFCFLPILFYLCYPGYNLFSLFMIIVLLYIIDIDFKYKDIVIGLLVSCLFLTKQTVGICCFIPMIVYSKNRLKSLSAFLIPILIFIIYLIFNGALYSFIDYCFLGMFDFSKSNFVWDFLPVDITVVIYFCYLLVKGKFRDEKLFYVIMYQVITLPICDPYHFFVGFVLIVYYLFLDFKINKLLVSVFFLFGIFLLTIYEFNFYVYFDKDSYLYYRNIGFSDKSMDYMNDSIINLYEEYDNVYLFTELAYLFKLDNNITINKYDLINNGNMGYNGALRYIEEFSNNCENKNCVFVLDSYVVENVNKFYEVGSSQINLEIISYVINNYNKVDENKLLFIYNNEEVYDE